MTAQRVNWVDIAKGIGIILVVYGHTARGLDSAGFAFGAFEAIDKFIYSFHMPLFFALSGLFFLKSVGKGHKEFIAGKTSTLLYPYLLWSLIQILIQYGASSLINGTVTWNDVVTFYEPRGQFWFLLGLLIISLTNLLSYKLMGLRGLLLTTTLSLLIIAFNVDLGVLSLGFNNLIYFNFGVLLAHHEKLFRYLLDFSVSRIIVVVFFVIGEAIFLYVDFNSVTLTLAVAFLGIIATFQLSANISDKVEILSDLGRNSMPIYLMHTIVSAGVRIILLSVLHIENVIIHLVVGTTLGLYLPFIAYKFFMADRLNFLFTIFRPNLSGSRR